MLQTQSRTEEGELGEPGSGRQARPQTDKPTIVVVGHGMVGQRMCEELSSKRALRSHRIVVFGEEPTPAYDRVHLCEVVRGGDAKNLQLSHEQWFKDNKVRLFSGDPVVAIDREGRFVTTKSGHREHYDHLILATGSSPNLGKFPGNDGRDVRALRTTEDAAFIRRKAIEAKEKNLPVVVVGGGLLGIELAEDLLRQSIFVIVLESAEFPLSRQLERSAGDLLSDLLSRSGLVLRTGVRVKGFVEKDSFTEVELEGDDPIECGLVVPAMGIRPRDQLARDAGLRCDMFGGIEVNDQLLTSDPHISAVGECARHRGEVYGLVAPGYAMAEVVAKRLAGGEARFTSVQVGTRLKSSQVELTVVGESSATGLGVKTSVFDRDGNYRRLITRRGRVIGAVALGRWPDFPRVQQAMARSEKLKPVQFKRFDENEPMWPKGGGLSLKVWPDTATVCTCMGVTCGALRKAIDQGCANVEALADRTGASTVCGTCKPLLSSLVDDEPEVAEGPSKWMVAFSLLSVVGTMTFLLAPSVPYQQSIRIEGIEVLWRTSLYKQITGFSLAGLFSLSIVFSMRKRIRWFSFGDFEAWRIVHAAIGALCVFGGFLHTGFRLGSHLDLALALVFLGSLLLGGVAGGWELLEERLSPSLARLLRGLLIKSHIYLLWPLPVLLVAHVAKVYFF